MSAETVINAGFAAVFAAAAVIAVWLFRKPRPAESRQDQFIREECTPGVDVWDDHANRWITLPAGVQPGPGQYTHREVASLDELTVAWDAPAYDPSTDPQWAAARARLADATRDHQNQKGDQA